MSTRHVSENDRSAALTAGIETCPRHSSTITLGPLELHLIGSGPAQIVAIFVARILFVLGLSAAFVLAALQLILGWQS
jgi:hypothetical protein